MPFYLAERPGSGPSTDREKLQRLAEIDLHERGRLRTAFPTDLSFGELYSENLFISPKLTGVGVHSKEGSSYEEISELLRTGGRVLVLGEPGSGKSFLAYLCQVYLHRVGCLPLSFDLGDFLRSEREDPGTAPSSASDVTELVKLSSTVPDSTVLIIDSLDEAVAQGASRETVEAVFESLSNRGAILALCRREEYEHDLYSAVRTTHFDRILVLRDWNPEGEFREYLKLLEKRGYPSLAHLMALVESQPEIAALVKRPLHARMLTFLWSDEQTTPEYRFDNPAGLTGLYERYLDGFSRTCEQKAASVFPTRFPRAQEIRSAWRDLAWGVFENAGLHGGGITDTDFRTYLQSHANEMRWGIKALLQSKHSLAGRTWSFLHYSFYEFLVAEAFVGALLSAYHDNDIIRGRQLFRRDQPREIRHFAVRLLRQATDSARSAFGQYLASIYRMDTTEPRSERLVTGNLLVYYLGRVVRDEVKDTVVSLLEGERDPFLRNSLGWAGCQIGDIGLLSRFAQEVSDDAEASALNRGYLMYYYGDLSRSLAPPYWDSGDRSWANTRRLTIEMMKEGEYQDHDLCRQLIDVVTFLSFVTSRGEGLSTEEVEILNEVLARVPATLSGAEVVQRVQQAIRSLRKGA